MAVTTKLYSNMPLSALRSRLTDLADAGTTVKVALVTGTYTFNQDTHEAFDDITNEVSGTGYTAGGATLSSVTVTTTGRVTTVDAADVTWTDSTITAAGAVIYDATPALAADQKLLAFVDFDGNETSESGDFTITWNASGIFDITVAA